MVSLTVSEHAGETVRIPCHGQNARKDKNGPVREHKGAVGSQSKRQSLPLNAISREKRQDG